MSSNLQQCCLAARLDSNYKYRPQLMLPGKIQVKKLAGLPRMGWRAEMRLA
jgi:hypothetical protein